MAVSFCHDLFETAGGSMSQPSGLYYPCIEDGVDGEITRKISSRKMSWEQAQEMLKAQQWDKWIRCVAFPQPIEMFGDKA